MIGKLMRLLKIREPEKPDVPAPPEPSRIPNQGYRQVLERRADMLAAQTSEAMPLLRQQLEAIRTGKRPRYDL